MISERTLRVIESAGPALLRFLGSTWRIRVLPRGEDEARWARGEHALFSFWHGRLLIPTFHYRFKGIGIMVSQHGDGEMISRVVKRLGHFSIRGSTTRGGRRAMLETLRRARAGHDIAFTPDGPRGPRYVVQKGVVYAASRAGLPIVPVAIEAHPAWVLGSWDEFTIPKPFAPVVIIHGEPMHVPPGIRSAEMEEVREDLEARMHHLTAKARKIVRETR